MAVRVAVGVVVGVLLAVAVGVAVDVGCNVGCGIGVAPNGLAYNCTSSIFTDPVEFKRNRKSPTAAGEVRYRL